MARENKLPQKNQSSSKKIYINAPVLSIKVIPIFSFKHSSSGYNFDGYLGVGEMKISPCDVISILCSGLYLF